MKRFLIVLCVLTVLILAFALPVFAADEPVQGADLHYNHFSTEIVRSYGMLDAWVAQKPGQRSVSFDRAINGIRIRFAPDDVGMTVISSSVPVDDFMPFFLSGDKFVYYAGGGGTYYDGGGFSLVFSSMETGGSTTQPRAYELSYIGSAQNTQGGATVRFQIRIPSDAIEEYVIPYIGIYRVNDLNRGNFYMPDSSSSDFGTGSTDVAHGIFRPFDLNSLIDYERNQGYAGGYLQGQQDGYVDGKEAGIEIGDQQGYIRGKAEGAAEGEVVGYNKGYAQGIADGSEYTFLNLMNSVVSVPVQALRGFLSFEIFGYNMLNFFGSVVTLMIGLWVLKTFVI